MVVKDTKALLDDFLDAFGETNIFLSWNEKKINKIPLKIKNMILISIKFDNFYLLAFLSIHFWKFLQWYS